MMQFYFENNARLRVKSKMKREREERSGNT